MVGAPQMTYAKGPKARAKARTVLHEFKQGSLHSGKGGPIVKSRPQAIAIALSEARRTVLGKHR